MSRVAARYEYLNAYKRGLVVDDGEATGAAVLDALIARSDVVVNSCDGDIASVMEFEQRLRQVSPKCVHVVTSAFGLTGPYSRYRSSELTRWAAGGFTQITGDPEQPPLQGGGPWADYATGITAAVGAMAALRAVASGSDGELVDVGNMEVMAAFHQWTLVLFTHQGVVKQRASNMHAESFHPMGPLPCKDGWVAIGIATVPQWEGFCLAIDLPELLLDERFQAGGDRFDRAAELNEVLLPRLGELAADELVELLQSNHVPAAKVLDVVELLGDRQLEARGFWAELDVGSATARLPDKPFRIASCDPPFTPAPAFGEHTEAILGELGYTQTEIEMLVESGAVRAATKGR
jgi:itaconate CoA-transferase